jgi:hypothetical protein
VPYCFQHCKDTTINHTNKFYCIFFLFVHFLFVFKSFIYLETNLKEPHMEKYLFLITFFLVIAVYLLAYICDRLRGIERHLKNKDQSPLKEPLR